MTDSGFEFRNPDPGEAAPYLKEALDAISLTVAGCSELTDDQAEALIFAYRWLRGLRNNDAEDQSIVQQQLSRVCVMLAADDGEVIRGDL